jgi:predicted nucleic acid-binding protein
VRPRIYFDTMLFSYLIEEHPDFKPPVERIYRRILERQDTLCTSTLTVGELLTGPEKRGNKEVASAIWQLLRPPQVELVTFDANTAAQFAKIRAETNVKPTHGSISSSQMTGSSKIW